MPIMCTKIHMSYMYLILFLALQQLWSSLKWMCGEKEGMEIIFILWEWKLRVKYLAPAHS